MAQEAWKGASYTFTTAVRAPFISVVNPAKVGRKGQEKGEPVYSLTCLLEADSPDLKALKELMAKLVRETWPGRDMKELKFPIESGAARAAKAAADGKDGSLYNNMVVFSARSGQDKPPQLAVLDGKTITELMGQQRDIVGRQKFYMGCYVCPSIWLAPYKKGSEGGIGEFSGIKAYLSSVLWVKDGPKIGGPSVTDTFKGYAGSISGESATAGLDEEIPY